MECIKLGSDAPECARTEEKGEDPEVPFKVYAAIAKAALDRALRELKSDAESDVCEFLQGGLCPQQHLPYDSDVAGRAVRAALGVRRKAETDFYQRLRLAAGVRKAQ